MNELSQHLAGSYEAHPSFRFDQRPFSIDANLLDAFDESYALITSFAAQLSPAQIVTQHGRCERLIHEVFAALEPQAQDDAERTFVRELARECIKLLCAEAKHFRARAARHSVHFDSEQSGDKALALSRDAHYFGTLSDTTVEAIREESAADLRLFRAKAAEGKVTRDDLSTNGGPTVRRIVQLLNAAFDANGTLDAVSVYMGRPMSVCGLALELSVPQSTWWSNAYENLSRPPHTLYAHVDESIAFPKAIVYLSDVDASTGPTSCYPGAYQALGLRPIQEIVGRIVANVGGPGSPLSDLYRKRYHQSMSSPAFRRHFMRLPPALRFNSHFGWDVHPDSDLERELVRSEQVMTGSAGTHIVFDGARLLHRGGLVQRDERVALQVLFSDTPTVRSRIVAQLKKRLK